MEFNAFEFRAWRARMGLTQTRAAEALGVSIFTVRRWEQGKGHPDSPRMVELALQQLEATACKSLSPTSAADTRPA